MKGGQTIRLVGDSQRSYAKLLIDKAPADAVVNIRLAARSTQQNALMWVLLSDVSRAMPGGRRHTSDVWKCLFMQACGHAVQFEEGLDGRPFPMGFSSSLLDKSQMNDLIEFIYAWGAENGVVFSEPKDPYERR